MRDIIIRNLNKSFGDRAVLRGFNAVIPAGKITCIMGSSGCGKTTLLNIIMGFLGADSGEITGIPDRISAVFQEDRLCEDFTPISNIRAVTGKAVPVSEIEKHLAVLGLSDSIHMPVKNLSGGMKRRVAIARAILYNAGLIILDEAFKGLDDHTKRITMDYLIEHVNGKTVIAVTHDTEEAEYLGGGIIRL